MSRTVWDKGGGRVDEHVQRFLAGDDVVHDRALFLHDVRASAAHVRGLARVGVLSDDEASALVGALDALATDYREGRFALDERFEDGHSAIEAVLVERLGDVGRKVHTGRSRNDQVQVAMRLYLLEQVDLVRGLVLDAADAFLARAEADHDTPMPGYTHLQRAVPSSVGLWLGAFAEAMLDDADHLSAVRSLLDASPLGTAAGYGVNLPLDREGVAQDLGLARVQLNPMNVQNGRGKLELAALSALLSALLDLRRFAWDVSLFTMAELAFVRLPADMTTGSSIMPNKKNPDVAELLRAAPAVAIGAFSEVLSVLSLPSGYQRDLQATKGPVLRAFAAGSQALALLAPLVTRMELDRARMRAAIDGDMYATDRAVELARAGVPFRTAYRQVAEELGTLAERTPEQSLRERVSLGAPGRLGLDRLRARRRALEAP